ncbi:hypothetical protein QZN11_34495 [Streptomyces gramineus]|uniref:hypothetical protein n=1 Tax=Streptomyces gramineus TaxID=910542 RepID=UPI00398AA742
MLGTPHLAGTRYGRTAPGPGPAHGPATGATPGAASGDGDDLTRHHAVRRGGGRAAPAGSNHTDPRAAPRAAPRGSHRAAHPARRRRALRRPVFIDRTGWRGRLVAATAAGLALACLGYLVLLGTLVAGLWRPAATAPPRLEDSVLPHPGVARPAGSRGGAVRAGSPGPSSGKARPPEATGGPVR